MRCPTPVREIKMTSTCARDKNDQHLCERLDVQHLGGVGHMDREARDKVVGHMETTLPRKK
jgi:hypothetical protein